MILHGNETAQTVQFLMIIGLGELPGRHVGDAQIRDASACNQRVKGSDHLLKISCRIPNVGLIKVDMIGPEPLQARR